MLRSYLAIALRHLVTQKLYSAINIAGLAVGLACFILIGLYVQHELSYDRHYANSDRIYRISRDIGLSEGLRLAGSVPGMAALMEQDFAQIERTARVARSRLALARDASDEQFFESVVLADDTFIEIFQFDWLRGDPSHALSEPFTAVLTESSARKYFGDEEALDGTLMLESRIPVRVTGVMADLPTSTHLSFDLLLSIPSGPPIFGESWLENDAEWINNAFYTYVLLEEGASIADVESRSDEFFDRHFREGASQYTRFTADPVTWIHLNSTRGGELKPPGSKAAVYAMAAIGVLVLLLACVNFTNLTTAMAARRAKEVGVRKAVGAERGQIVVQFLGESILLSVVAVVLAAAIAELALPAYQGAIGVELSFSYLSNPRTLGALAAIAVLVGIAAGAYPALYLSAFEPARVLKDDVARGASAATFRKALVVGQFSISIALIIASVVASQQVRFVLDSDLGYRTDEIVLVSASGFRDLRQQWGAFKQQLLSHPGITHATLSSSTPGNHADDLWGVRAEGGGPDWSSMNFMMVHFDFFETYEIEVVAGRAFSEALETDRTIVRSGEGMEPRGAYMLNELAARQFGWAPEEAVGKRMEIGAGSYFQVPGSIIGVVRDVHLRTLHEPIQPLFYMVPPEQILPGYEILQQISLRISGREMRNALDHIDGTWAEFVPSRPVSRRFLREQRDASYRAEQLQGRLLTTFALLAVFIACLGLLGLSAYATERRTKEIGVRKIMGATVADVVRLFTGEFGRLVLLANVIAWPVAYFLMQRWLETFAYRVDMSPLVFTAGGLIGFALAWLTVGLVAARAAAANPIHSLRYE